MKYPIIAFYDCFLEQKEWSRWLDINFPKTTVDIDQCYIKFKSSTSTTLSQDPTAPGRFHKMAPIKDRFVAYFHRFLERYWGSGWVDIDFPKTRVNVEQSYIEFKSVCQSIRSQYPTAPGTFYKMDHMKYQIIAFFDCFLEQKEWSRWLDINFPKTTVDIDQCYIKFKSSRSTTPSQYPTDLCRFHKMDPIKDRFIAYFYCFLVSYRGSGWVYIDFPKTRVNVEQSYIEFKSVCQSIRSQYPTDLCRFHKMDPIKDRFMALGAILWNLQRSVGYCEGVVDLEDLNFI